MTRLLRGRERAVQRASGYMTHLIEVQQEINQLAQELLLLRLAIARRQPTEHDRVTIRALQSRLVKLYREKRAVLAALCSLVSDSAEELWPADERAIWTLARLVTPNGCEKGRDDAVADYPG